MHDLIIVDGPWSGGSFTPQLVHHGVNLTSRCVPRVQQILEGMGKARHVVVGVLLRYPPGTIAETFEVSGSGVLVFFGQLCSKMHWLALLEKVLVPLDVVAEGCSGRQAILPMLLQLPVGEGGAEGRGVGGDE